MWYVYLSPQFTLQGNTLLGLRDIQHPQPFTVMGLPWLMVAPPQPFSNVAVTVAIRAVAE